MKKLERAKLDEEIARCAIDLSRGDQNALELLFDLTASRAFRYAVSLTRHADDAEDVLQTVMVKLAVYPKHLSQAKQPWAYLLRMIRNESFDFLQKKQKLHKSKITLATDWEDADPFAQCELEASVKNALTQLPSQQSEVVILKIWEEMTFQEIGQTIGESMNTAASRYRYALSKLQNLLSEYDSNSNDLEQQAIVSTVRAK